MIPNISAPAFAFVAILATALALTSPAAAGPTVAADLDLGTSVKRTYLPGAAPDGGPTPPAALYLVGLRIRAGWRFDVGPVFLLPEIGGGYDVERFTGAPSSALSLPRVFGGARAGLSLALAPALRFEPAIYGHAGDAWYAGARGNGLALDTGLALDLRLLKYVIVGVQVGYDVVTVWQSQPSGSLVNPPTSGCAPLATGCATSTTTPAGALALADGWVSYGVHAGVLFW